MATSKPRDKTLGNCFARVDDSDAKSMSERLALFEQALDECRQLLARYPENATLESIGKQIQYLVGVESGALADRSRLRDVIIGVQTAREIDPLDEGVAEVFYKVASEAGRMQLRVPGRGQESPCHFPLRPIPISLGEECDALPAVDDGADADGDGDLRGRGR